MPFTNTNNRGSTTIAKELIKETKNERIKRLRKHRWGIGLEHEMQIFHKPRIDTRKNIESFIMFSAKPRVEELLKSNKLSLPDREFLQSLPFEPTGRKCFGKIVLEKTPVDMPEFVTEKPFSSLETGKRPIESYVVEMKNKEERFMILLHLNEKVIKLEEKYGELYQYPFGMTNYLKYSETDSIHYKFKKDKRGKDKLHTDYLGSYHITLTLPFTERTSLKDFIGMHQNYANQIQWLEPLLATAFFSSDQKAVGTPEKRIKGSYRVARVGWGNFAGSDVRKFSKGIGRYANIKSYWRNGFDFYESERVEACQKLSPELKKKEPGAVSAYSSNFRTFGSTDPMRPWHRESGKGMNKPNGVELRIFDHFDSYYFRELARFVIHVAENSRTTKAKKYVYDNKAWIEALRRIMLHGWRAELPFAYIDELRKQLGLKINIKSVIAYDVLGEINRELFAKNRRGDWCFLMLEKEYKEAPKLPQINRRSWETGLMLKLNRNKKLMADFNKMVAALPKNKISLFEFKMIFFRYFEEANWKNDVEDVVYFLQEINFVKLTHKSDGHIDFIERYKTKKVKNFNEEIRIEWTRPFYEDFYYFITKLVAEENNK